MKYFLVSLILVFIFVLPLNSQELQWNRYTNSNFEILSIDDEKGAYLNKNISSIKAWIVTRWGFNNSLVKKTKVVLTSTDKNFKEFFSKDPPQFKITDDEITIWLSSENPKWHTSNLTKVMTEVCLQEIENKQNSKFGFWVHRGMPLLNSDIKNIRQNFGNLSILSQKKINAYGTRDILTMTPEKLAKQPVEIAMWYDSQSAALMLLLVKEYGGIKKFNAFIKSPDPEITLRNIYQFNSFADCDVVLNRFIFNLSSDIIGQGQKITPNSYLTWILPS